MSAILDSRFKNRRLPSVDAPQVDDQSLRQFLEGVKEHLRMYEGDSGAPKERFITIEELELAGLVTTKVQSGFASIVETPFGPVSDAKSADVSGGGGSGIRRFRDLDDTAVSGIASGEGVVWSGTKYVPIQMPPFTIEPATQYDMMFRGAENWENTNQQLTWNSELGFLQLALGRQINWLDSGSATQELLIFEKISESADPDFADVVLLLSSQGRSNGETTLIDHSSYAHAVSFGAAGDHSTDQAKFNSTSLDVRSNTSFITVPDHAAFDLAGGDWTMEFWVYPAVSNFNHGCIEKDQFVSGERSFEVSFTSSNLTFEYTTDGIVNLFQIVGTVSGVNQWHYIVVQRTGTLVESYVNGTLQGASFNVGTDVIWDGPTDLYVGTQIVSSAFLASNNYMDDVRITVGTARYSGGTMTVPTTVPDVIVSTDVFTVGDPVFDTVIDGLTVSTVADTSLGGTLGVTGVVTFSDQLSVLGSVTFQSTFNGQDAVDFDSTLNVDGGVTLGSTLDVIGQSDFHDALVIDNDVYVRWVNDALAEVDLITFGNFGAGDSDFSSVVLLYNMDGADAATNITDASDSAHVETFVGNAQLDTAQANNGSASLLLDGTGDWLTSPDHADWHFGSGAFTIDVAVRFNVLPTGGAGMWFISHYDTTADKAWAFGYLEGTGLAWVWSSNGTAFETTASEPWSPVINVWYQLRVVRSGSTIYLFIDGVLQGSGDNVGANAIFDAAQPLTLGALGNATTPVEPMNGWIDDVRITKGVARSTATYALPTLGWPAFSGTDDETLQLGDENAVFPTRIFGSAFSVTPDANFEGEVDVVGKFTAVYHERTTELVTATNVITAAESGKTFYLDAAGGFTSTLPVPAAGLHYKFIVKTAPTTAYIVTTDSGANILEGTFLDIVGELQAIAAQDTFNFVATVSLVGDSLEVESDGVSWFCTAFSKADGGITVSVT